MIPQSTLLLATMVLTSASGGSWLNPPPTPFYSAPSIQITHFREVDKKRRNKAILLLANNADISLTGKEAASFLLRPFECPKSMRPVLVRAVVGFEGGGFYVVKSGSSLLVQHSSLGHTTPQPIKTALIACLEFQPRNLYIAMSVAE